MTRAVPDTNVHVSALVFGGKPARVLQLAAAGTFQLIVSESIQAELLETLATRFAWPADRAAEVCAQLWDAAHWVVHPQQVRAARDPEDDHILACALTAGADVIVTGDHDLLVLHPFRGVDIVTPAEFLANWVA